MSEEGVEDELVGALRVAVQAGGQLAEMLARVHAHRMRVLVGKDRPEAAELRNRMAAERASAVAFLERANEGEWLEKSSHAEIGEAYGVAATWRDYAPEAEAAERAMREQLRERYGDPRLRLVRSTHRRSSAAWTRGMLCGLPLIRSSSATSTRIVLRASCDLARPPRATA